jgi:hypothetical protein
LASSQECRGVSTHENQTEQSKSSMIKETKTIYDLKAPLQKILQGILHKESKTHHKHERTDSTKLQEKKKQESRE